MQRLVVAALLAATSVRVGVAQATDRVLAARVHHLLDLAFSDQAGDDQAAEVRKLFAERGLPTTALVGPEAAEEFIVLSAHDQTVPFMKEVLAAIGRAPAAVPPHAVRFLRARVKQKEIESALRTPYPNAALAARLAKLYAADQEVRRREPFDARKMLDTDTRTGHEVRAIFKESGVPTQSTVGPEAARQFVVMVQHQPADLRRAVLPKLRENVMRGEADPAEYAMMFDRAQVDEGKPQRYGANFACQPDGTWAPSPIEDAAHVDDRRTEIGLLPMRLYSRLLVQSMPKGLCQKVTAPLSRKP